MDRIASRWSYFLSLELFVFLLLDISKILISGHKRVKQIELNDFFRTFARSIANCQLNPLRSFRSVVSCVCIVNC